LSKPVATLMRHAEYDRPAVSTVVGSKTS
jgi:hypothetical protein